MQPGPELLVQIKNYFLTKKEVYDRVAAKSANPEGKLLDQYTKVNQRMSRFSVLFLILSGVVGFGAAYLYWSSIPEIQKSKFPIMAVLVFIIVTIVVYLLYTLLIKPRINSGFVKGVLKKAEENPYVHLAKEQKRDLDELYQFYLESPHKEDVDFLGTFYAIKDINFEYDGKGVSRLRQETAEDNKDVVLVFTAYLMDK